MPGPIWAFDQLVEPSIQLDELGPRAIAGMTSRIEFRSRDYFLARDFAAVGFFLVDRLAVVLGFALVDRLAVVFLAAVDFLVVEVFFLVDRFAGFAFVAVFFVAFFVTEAFFFVERLAVVPDLALVAVFLVVRVDFLAEGFAFDVVDRLAGVFLAGLRAVLVLVAIPVAPR